jgi:hypothetical protein
MQSQNMARTSSRFPLFTNLENDIAHRWEDQLSERLVVAETVHGPTWAYLERTFPDP